MSRFRAYGGVARAPFLLLPVTLVASGSAAAAYGGHFDWLATVLALAGLVALHAAVNTLNEVTDMQTGVDLHTMRTPFSGGSGTLPSGALSVRAARAFGLGCALLGFAIGLWFAFRIGWSFVPVMVIGGIAVMLYSQIFARTGLGELFAGLGLGAVPVWGAAMVQGGTPGAAAFAAAIPAFFMTFNLLLLNEFPDESADRMGGRRNLVLLFGRTAAAHIYAAAALMTPAAIVAAVALRALPLHCLIAALPSLFLIRPLRWAFVDSAQAVPIPALADNVIWNLLTNALLALALAIAIL